MTKAAELAKMGEVLTNSQIGGRRNIVINGAMQVAQRGTSATGVGSGFAYPTLDRYKIVPSTSGRATMTQTADGPSGFANCLKLECTTADTSIAATEYFILRQSFEGQDLQSLKKGTSDAEKVTVSFYVKGNASATYTCELDDADNTRHNSQEFSVTTNWTRVILTFVGDTTGAFDDDNARSLNLDFWLHAGSNFTGGTHTDNVWHTTDNQRVGDSQSSFFDSTDRTFFITGIQMEIGEQATPFEHRSFGEELALCQRYFSSSYAYGTAIGSETGSNGEVTPIGHMSIGGSYNILGQWIQPTPMRSSPTIVIYNPVTGTVDSFRGDGSNYSGAKFLNTNEKGTTFYIHATTVTATVFVRIHATFDSEL